MLPSASGIGSSFTEGEDAFVQSQQTFGHLDEAQVSFRLLGRLCDLSVRKRCAFCEGAMGPAAYIPVHILLPALHLYIYIYIINSYIYIYMS